MATISAGPRKRCGTWMTSLRDRREAQHGPPDRANVCRLHQGHRRPALALSPDDAQSLFHKLGHGLHGMLWDIVPIHMQAPMCSPIPSRFPSQLYEHSQASLGAAAICRTLPDRRAAAGRSPATLPGGAQIQPGLCQRGIRGGGGIRSRIPHPRSHTSREVQAFERQETKKPWAVPQKPLRQTAAAIRPPLLSAAIAVGRAITATCGPEVMGRPDISGLSEEKVGNIFGSRGGETPARRHLCVGRLRAGPEERPMSRCAAASRSRRRAADTTAASSETSEGGST